MHNEFAIRRQMERNVAEWLARKRRSLKERRIARGWTVEQLADLCGVRADRIRAIEAGAEAGTALKARIAELFREA